MVYYEPIPASDGTSLTAPSNAEFRVFEVSDTARANPLELRTVSGLNAAPLVTTAQGVLPGVEVASPNFSHIFKSGEWEWRRDSVEGIRKAAEEAQRSSTAAASDAQGAKASAEAAASVAGEAAVSIVQQKLAAGEFKGDPGKTGLPGINAVPADEAVASYLSRPDSATSQAAGKHLVGKGELFIDVKDYGAKGDGVTDDTAAIVAAEAAAFDLMQRLGAAPRLFMAGRFKTTGRIQFRVDTDAAQALVQYYGTGRAIQVGTDAPGAYTTDKEFRLPRVVKMNPPAGTWDGTSEGVVVTNVNQCRIWIPRVETFEKGVRITGNAAGTAYSEFYLGSLWVNRENLILDQGADGKGWVNQNQFYGGRITHSSSRGVLDDPGASMLRLGNESGGVLNPPDGNTFYGLSLEGRENRAKQRVKNYGRYTQFFNCRWESIGVTPVFHSYEYAGDNVIWGGYHADKLALTGIADAVRVNTTTRRVVDAVATNGQLIPNDEPTRLTGWVKTSSTTEPLADGFFTPHAGRWRVFARVAFPANTAGSRITRLRQGANIIDQHITPGSGSAPISGVVEATRRFNGVETFSVDVQQSSGASMALVSSASYVRIYAEYLGA